MKTPRKSTTSLIRKAPPQLLLVEDDDGFASLLTMVFQKAGYHVTNKSCYHDASICLITNTYDVIISDYHLGDGTGDALLCQAQHQYPPPLTVLMSADQRVALYAKQCQADAWYEKGNPIKDLLSLIRR